VIDSRLPDRLLTGPVELTNCDREPVHRPGGVQPFGCLVAISLETGIINEVSENVADYLGQPATELLGQPIGQISKQLTDLHELLNAIEEGRYLPRRQIVGHSHVLSVAAHHCDGVGLVEFEPELREEQNVRFDLVGELFSRIDRQDLQASYQQIVETIREFAGFDRVMLYKFHEDHHGSVIAEACQADMEPFLGLHYPASDIPVPARRLYELNWIRSIVDVNAAPIPLVGDASQGDLPLNMTYSSLRAISPIHLEYLRNMGVGASMSISIMEGSRLWGLIACHHNSAMVVPPVVRDACELCGSVLSTYLMSRRQQDALEDQVNTSEAIAEIMPTLANYDSLGEGIQRCASQLTDLFDSHGLVWHDGQDAFFWGEVPGRLSLEELVSHLAVRPDEPVVYTDCLAETFPAAGRFSDRCAGVLALRPGRREAGLLMFFRKPFAHVVTWAGEPQKRIDHGGRLSPRQSFSAWQEEVTNRSQPWTEANRRAARTLVSTLGSVVAEHAARLQRDNDELRQLNADLDAFVYAASHDLKEPLRILHHYTYLIEQSESRDDEQYTDGVSGLKRMIQRMSDLLDGLLRFSRAGRADLQLESFQLSEIVDQAIDILFGGTLPEGVRVDTEQNVTLRGDFACVREIVSNLISNAIKYNEQAEKRIVVSVLAAEQTPLSELAPPGEPCVVFRDNGIGIDPRFHRDIFEIFRRLHARDAFGGGSGAGLTIVRRMVERHGGQITVESTLGEGTSFYFTLGPA